MDILEIAEKLAIPSSDDGEKFENKDRLKAIKKLLKNSGYRKIMKGKLYRLYGQKELQDLPKDLILVSTHVDCLQSKKNFSQNDEFIHGIFDNAATNAAIVWLMLHNKLPEHVIVGFTGDEEYDSGGAIELGNALKEQGKNVKVVVLDVTSSGWEAKADFTIENNFWRKEEGHTWGRKILELANASEYEWRFVSSKSDEKDGYLDTSLFGREVPCDKLEEGDAEYGAAGTDESWTYEEWQSDEKEENLAFNVFSLCIPCSAQDADEMHSNKGFDIRKTSFKRYIRFLQAVLEIV